MYTLIPDVQLYTIVPVGKSGSGKFMRATRGVVVLRLRLKGDVSSRLLMNQVFAAGTALKNRPKNGGH
jgi:hypothetical protein